MTPERAAELQAQLGVLESELALYDIKWRRATRADARVYHTSVGPGVYNPLFILDGPGSRSRGVLHLGPLLYRCFTVDGYGDRCETWLEGSLAVSKRMLSRVTDKIKHAIDALRDDTFDPV